MVSESEKHPGKDLSKVWNSSWERIGLLFPHLFEVPELFSRNSVMLKLRNDIIILFYRIHKGDILVSLSHTPEGPWKDEGISFLTKKLPWETERNRYIHSGDTGFTRERGKTPQLNCCMKRKL